MDKTTLDKTFQAKDPLTKAPDKRSREHLRENLYRELLSGLFALDLLKMGGPRCVTYFWRGVPRCVTKCDMDEGGQNWTKIAWRTLWTASQLRPPPLFLAVINKRHLTWFDFLSIRLCWYLEIICFKPKMTLPNVSKRMLWNNFY